MKLIRFFFKGGVPERHFCIAWPLPEQREGLCLALRPWRHPGPLRQPGPAAGERPERRGRRHPLPSLGRRQLSPVQPGLEVSHGKNYGCVHLFILNYWHKFRKYEFWSKIRLSGIYRIILEGRCIGAYAFIK